MKLIASVVGACAFTVLLTTILVGFPTALPPPERNGAVLRIATANVAFDNTEPRATDPLLSRLDADVLIVLEWTGDNAGQLLLDDPRWFVAIEDPRPSPHGTLVLVRDEMDVDAVLVPTPVAGPCPLPFATLRVRSDREWWSILGVHAPPPIKGCAETNGPTLALLDELVDRGRMTDDFGVCHRGDRVILAGDFNALPRSRSLAALRESGLTDTHARLHWRPIGTWSSNWVPYVARIDYVLVSDDVPVLGSWTVQLPGSDHRAVIADLGRPD